MFKCGESIINRTVFTGQEVRTPCHSPSIGVIVMATPTKAWTANWCLESSWSFLMFFKVDTVNRGLP